MAGRSTDVRTGDAGERWTVAASHDGTVVVAAAAAPGPTGGAVYAAVRDPRGSFSPPQEVRSPDPAAYPYDIDSLPAVTILPVARDGTVTVSWNIPSGPAPWGTATRLGRAPRFGAPTAAPPAPDDDSVRYTVDSRRVKIARDIRDLCGLCSDLRFFAWPGARPMIAFQRVESVDSHDPPVWWVARREGGGMFGHARPVWNRGEPVWTPKPGRIEFLEAIEGDHAGRYGGLYRVPFGVQPRKSPRVLVTQVRAGAPDLAVQVRCLSTCRLQASIRALRGSRPTGPVRRMRAAFGKDRLQTFEFTDLEATMPRTVARMQMTITARGPRGRSSRPVVVLRNRTEDTVIESSRTIRR